MEDFLDKTDNEWRQQLSPEEYRVLRQKGTEPAFDNLYFDNEEAGDYFCAACHQPLFSSETKYDSGTGWPSFYAPVDPEAITLEIDDPQEMIRDEVICSRCGSHLGHLFNDGPAPSGQRYCLNSVCLRFEQQ